MAKAAKKGKKISPKAGKNSKSPKASKDSPVKIKGKGKG